MRTRASSGRRRLALLAAMIAATSLGACIPWRRQAGPYSKVTVEPQLTVFMHETGEVEAMPLERYLEGVVAAEMDTGWPLEALKAQAILARTFTIEALQRKGGTRDLTGTDVTTDETRFQAYDAGKVNDQVRQAVAQTRGHVLVTARGDPIRAWFHSDAGGKTATAQEGLGFGEAPPPYIKVVDAPSDYPEARWDADFGIDEVMAALRTVKPGLKAAAPSSARITAKGPSGRATEIALGSERVSAPALRTALGSTRMRSTLLDAISLSGGRLRMSGRGNGHGVGMPQWSARLLAERGEAAAAILYRFYAGVKVEQWWR